MKIYKKINNKNIKRKDTKIMMTFSEKLVVLRKIKHLTQDEFASAVGVSRQAVYKWESGQSYPEVQKLLEMKMLFNISIDDLLDETFEIELPKKKRKKRAPKAETTEAAAPVEKVEAAAPVKEEAPAPVVKEATKAPAPVKKEKKAAPAAEKVVEEVIEEVAAPAEEPVETKEEAIETEKAPEIKFNKEMPKVQGPAPKEINDPTENFAKRGGLFGKIFGKK